MRTARLCLHPYWPLALFEPCANNDRSFPNSFAKWGCTCSRMEVRSMGILARCVDILEKLSGCVAALFSIHVLLACCPCILTLLYLSSWIQVTNLGTISNLNILEGYFCPVQFCGQSYKFVYQVTRSFELSNGKIIPLLKNSEPLL